LGFVIQILPYVDLVKRNYENIDIFNDYFLNTPINPSVVLREGNLRCQIYFGSFIHCACLLPRGIVYICAQMELSNRNTGGYGVMDVNELKGKTFKGFMADDEATRLYELAREAARHGPCLEIGSYCGHSAAYLGLGCQETGGILFSIDHHRGSEEQQPGGEYHDPELLDPGSDRIDTFPLFRKTLQELSLDDTVVPIVSRSDVAARLWRTPLSLIFIDGGHTFETVFADYNCWTSFLLSGGYLIIHDVIFDPALGGQAPRCIYQLALASGLFRELPMIRTLGILQRAPADHVTDIAFERWRNISALS
jgi:predicted O-methyltransferase YrrM